MSIKTSEGGKVRGKRYRLHPSAPKPKQTVSEIEEIPQLYIQPIQKNVPLVSNIFKNIIIPPTILKQSLPSYSKKDMRNFEVKQVICHCEMSEGRARRRELDTSEAYVRRKKIPFHEVVASAKDFLKKKEKEKKKKANEILGNFQALEEALPDLEQLVEENKKEDNKPRAAKRFPTQQQEMMKDLLTFQEVLTNPEYIRNPIATITDQLRQRIESGHL